MKEIRRAIDQVSSIQYPPKGQEKGRYVLVGMEPSPKEQHHEVIVLDEEGIPLSGVKVVFGYGSGKEYNFNVREDYWVNRPYVIKGNVQVSNRGYALHTTGKGGGEDIFIFDVNREGQLFYSSVIAKGCKSVDLSNQGYNLHTGVKLTFQRQTYGYIPKGDRLKDLERRVYALEQAMKQINPLYGSNY